MIAPDTSIGIDTGVSDAGDASRDVIMIADSARSDSSRVDSGVADSGVVDSGVVDSGVVDSGAPDTSRPGCDVGDPCNPTRGCRLSPLCIDEFMGEIGGADDPITGLPGGGTGVPITSWVDGYCSNAAAVDMGGCDPDDETSCGGLSCAVCLDAGQDARGVTVGLCAMTCTPSLTTSSCRPSYECSLTSSACVPGCMIDDECRIVRDDTNGNGIIDPYDPMANPGGDRLVYDASTSGSCNTVTARCEHGGVAGAEAGDSCDHDFECERNGECIQDFGTEGGWPGGYCTKFGCDVAGNDCAGAGKCQERGVGAAICLDACEVARTVSTSRFSATLGCPAGYTCFWDGTSGLGSSNGGCVPGNFNAVRTNNIGAACTDESTCYSPYGAGQCRDFGSGNHCTLFDCAAPGMPSDICGSSALCATVSGTDTTFCAPTCTTASDCRLGDGCWDTTAAGIGTGGSRICFPGCMADSDCRSTETCVGGTLTMVGECM